MERCKRFLLISLVIASVTAGSAWGAVEHAATTSNEALFTASTFDDTCSSVTVANAGTDQTVCTSTATLAGNTPTLGSGTWSVISGTAAVTSPSDPTSGVTGLSDGLNMFEWMIAYGSCPTTRDTVSITKESPPTAANAGTDQTVCATITTLAGNVPTAGSGAWTVLAGSATVTTPSDPTSGVTGLSVGVNSFVWTISNGTCPSSKDTVTIIRDENPTTANAGPDETVCSTTTTLAGNTPSAGLGAWTVIAGGASVTTPGNPASGVTGLSVGANTFVWTISNGTCPSSNDTVTITRDENPTTANAGSDETVCATTTTLAGNTPSVGTGFWTVIAGGASVTTPGDPTSGVTELTVGANTFVWTISNLTCPSSKDTVTITRDANPTSANAGPDETVCGTTTALAGNTPSLGSGLWTVIAGSATVTFPVDPTSGVTGLSVGANIFVWTISNGTCPSSKDTVTITRDEAPTTANAGTDFGVCTTTATLAGNVPSAGSGTWAVIAGGGSVTTPSSPTSGVTGLSLGANSFVWTISNASCPPSADTVTITREAQPTLADAGPDQTVCAAAATLAGNTPSVGTGTWSVIAGTGSVTTPGSPTSGVTALSVGANTFVWTISSPGCGSTSDTVTITRDASPTTADAGPDQTVCATTAALAGNTPSIGTGTWTVIEGSGSVTTPSSPASGVTGLSVGANSFVWTISNATCPSSSDTVTITRSAPPTTADAGSDQTVCATTATLAGSTPAIGTGTWAVISGSATVTIPSDPSSGVTGLSIGSNLFEWMISNGVCATSRDTVSIVREAAPSAANAGPDQSVCSATSTLAGNTPASGTGTWSVIGGGGAVTSPSNPSSGVTGLSVGSNTFVWTISNGTCPTSSDTIVIDRDQPPTIANAGSDQTVCAQAATLAGNTPAVGSGIWTVAGGGASVTTPSNPASGVTGLSVGANTFVWTISNGTCPSSSDTVIITRDQSPTTADAGADFGVCAASATLAGNTPTNGTGVWTVIAGGASVTAPGSPASGVTGLSVGTNSFVWTISNASCPSSSDTVTITRAASPTAANAGSDQTVCAASATLAGNTPAVGTGTWTVIAGSASVTTPGDPASGVTGLSVGSNSFVWTIGSPGCGSTSDTVIITRDPAATAADAGADQSVCSTNATLAGNTPSIGTGTWTVVSGSASVTLPNDPASGVTGLSVGANVFEWMISNGVCATTRDTVSITRNAPPSASNAGPDQTVCSTSATLAGNVPSTGTGTWVVLSGGASVTIPADPASGVTGLSVGSNLFEWMISNGVCATTRDTINIVREAAPTAANAGPDFGVCSDTTTLNANVPVIGSGSWTVLSGSGSVSTPNQASSHVTGLSIGANMFVWTITNGICAPSKDTVTVTRDLVPTIANAGPDQTVCAATATLAGNTPAVGTGTWTVMTGGAAVTAPNNPSSGVTGLAVGVNSFVWTISSTGCGTTRDTMNIVRDPSPTASNAGPDQEVCAATATLAANAPVIGSGAWVTIAGSGVATAPANPASGVTNLSSGINSFVWTISNGTCPPSRDTVTILRDQPPTAANAGPDQTICSSNATLAGNTPVIGTGTWTVILGNATIASPNSPNSALSLIPYGINKLVWTISNGTCPPTRDTVTITRNIPPTIANAGPDQTLCGTSTTLAGNTPTDGTGAWSVITGSAAVTTPASPTSGVTGLSFGVNRFVWTISNGACSPSSDTVVVMRDQPPTTANAGFDQTACSSTATLAGNTPTIGSGIWTVIAGTGAVTTPTNPSSGVTGLSLGPNSFVWTISNGTCTSSRDTVTISRSTAITFSTSATDVNCNGGNDGSITVTASGGTGALSYSRDNGVNFQPSNVFNNLVVGTYKIVVTDAAGCITGSQSVTIGQPAPILIGPTTIANGSVLIPYTQTFFATGGTTPYAFSASGSVPPGLTMAASGVLSGTPTAAGIFIFTVIDTDAHNCVATRGYSITIRKKSTTSVLSQSISLTLVGDTVTFRDSVSPLPDGGLVQFKDGLANLGSAVALDPTGVVSMTTSGLTLGHHNITAFFKGTANYDTSTSNLAHHVVSRPDSSEYRTATYDDWATALDQYGKFKAVKRVADKVDFRLTITAPAAAIGFKLSFNMTATGTTWLGPLMNDSLRPFTPWDHVDEVTYVYPVDSGATFMLEGRGFKGKYITVAVAWQTPVHATTVNYKSLFRFEKNQPGLPMPNLNNVGEEMMPNDAAEKSLVFPDGLVVGAPRGSRGANSVRLKKYRDVQRTLVSQTQSGPMYHTGDPRCLSVGIDDQVNLNFRQQSSLPPSKYSNKLFAEVLAMKLNIGASVMNKFPNGLGELTFNDANDPTNIFNNLTLIDIMKKADTVLSCLSTDIRNHQITIGEVYQFIRGMDSVLSGPLDTISFASKTALTGAVRLIDIPFLHKTQGLIPLSIISPVFRDPVPTGYQLYQNYPNPFNPTTTIQFQLAEPATVSLKIYNMLGQEVATVIDNQLLTDGVQEVDFNAGNLASGVYFYRIVAQPVANEDGGTPGKYFAQAKRMLLVK